MQNTLQWQEALDELAGIIRRSDLDSSIKWGAEVFTFEGKNVVSYGGFKNYFALWFFNGVFLKDRYKVLVNAQEGKTRSLRQWRFTSIDQIEETKILQYIEEAIEVERKGLKIVPQRSVPISIPDLLVSAFNDIELKAAFERLTPGKQNEYIVHINEARQEATKLRRIEKIKPMILQGIGLNDKYKK